MIALGDGHLPLNVSDNEVSSEFLKDIVNHNGSTEYQDFWRESTA